jgi:hypothetical protein
MGEWAPPGLIGPFVENNFILTKSFLNGKSLQIVNVGIMAALGWFTEFMLKMRNT